MGWREGEWSYLVIVVNWSRTLADLAEVRLRALMFRQNPQLYIPQAAVREDAAGTKST